MARLVFLCLTLVLALAAAQNYGWNSPVYRKPFVANSTYHHGVKPPYSGHPVQPPYGFHHNATRPIGGIYKPQNSSGVHRPPYVGGGYRPAYNGTYFQYYPGRYPRSYPNGSYRPPYVGGGGYKPVYNGSYYPPSVNGSYRPPYAGGGYRPAYNGSYSPPYVGGGYKPVYNGSYRPPYVGPQRPSGGFVQNSSMPVAGSKLAHDLILGARQPGDALELSVPVERSSSFMSVISFKQQFFLPRGHVITVIHVQDTKPNGKGAYASVTKNWVGYNNVTISFVSQRNQGVHFRVNLYGRRQN